VPAGLQERPSSHLLRVAVCRDSEDNPISHLFVKLFKPKAIDGGLDAMCQRVARDYETHRRVYSSMLPSSDLGAVPPVACYPELLALITEEVKGPTLLSHLQAQAAWFPTKKQLEQLLRTMATAGRWIPVFQSTESSGNYLTIDELRKYINIRLERLVRDASPRFTKDDRERVLRHLDLLGLRIAHRNSERFPSIQTWLLATSSYQATASSCWTLQWPNAEAASMI
jgi:hypothetical protein